MDMKSLYDKYKTKLELTRLYWRGKSRADNPLYIHGTFIEKLDSIWREGIKPGGSVPANHPPFVIPGYVSLQKLEFSAASGHGDITLILDGMGLDSERLGFHEQYEHEIYRGNIPIELILAIDIRGTKDAERVYDITARKVPVVRNTDQLVLS